jgi:cation diffusion facilitator family transporter
MLTFFRKLFIKNYKDVDDINVRANHGKLSACFGIITNFLLFVLKIVFGILTFSIAIIGDSINNLSDMATSLITLIGFKISAKPADKEHPFGHQRLEYIAGLIVSVVVVALACILFYTSVQKIIANEYERLDDWKYIWTFAILGFAVALKLIQGYFYYRMSKIINSVALKALSVDSLTDSLSTLFILISTILAFACNWLFLDGYLGALMACFVAFSGIKMIKETSDPLIGKAADKNLVKKVVDEIKTKDGVLGIHDVMCHMYGPTKVFMSLHVEVDSKKDIIVSHDLIDSIEQDIKNKYSIDLVIHMDPIDNSNPLTISLREEAVNFLKELSPSLSIHDFRAVHGNTHTNLIFDIIVPFDFKMNDDTIIAYLKKKLNAKSDKRINLVVHIDKPFIQ